MNLYLDRLTYTFSNHGTRSVKSIETEEDNISDILLDTESLVEILHKFHGKLINISATRTYNLIVEGEPVISSHTCILSGVLFSLDYKNKPINHLHQMMLVCSTGERTNKNGDLYEYYRTLNLEELNIPLGAKGGLKQLNITAFDIPKEMLEKTSNIIDEA